MKTFPNYEILKSVAAGRPHPLDPALIPASDSGNSAQKQSGVDAIESYIDQRDELWRKLALDQAKLSRAALILLKDRNDFVEAMFRFDKIVNQLFSPERIEREKQRSRICESFVEQIQPEIETLVRQADALSPAPLSDAELLALLRLGLSEEA